MKQEFSLTGEPFQNYTDFDEFEWRDPELEEGGGAGVGESVYELLGEVSRSSPDYVRWVQRALNQAMGLRLAVDGDLGPKTRSAIRSFQLQQSLDVDGVVGPQTEFALVTLTGDGRALLEASRRDPVDREAQRFYAGVRKSQELAHDAQIYRAYRRSAERLVERGARVRRVVLDYELKRDYQRFLRDLNRERRRAERDGDAAARDVAEWAARRDLPVVDGHVHFPDVRIEYERPDGERKVEDVEVVTPHYRGAYAAAKGRTGFSCYRIDTGVGGRGGRSGRSPDPRIFEEFLG